MYKQLAPITSAIVWILLPKCSACLLAYMGLFSALGIGGVINNPYTLPVIKILLVVNVAVSLVLAWKNKQYAYAILSVVCSAVFVLNKLYFQSMPVNLITCFILIMAALQIRLIRVRKSTCLFQESGKVAC